MDCLSRNNKFSLVDITFLAVFGGALLILPKESISINITGILLALGAGASYAAISVFSKRLLGVAPPLTVTSIMTFFGAIFMLPLLFLVDLTWLKTPQGWGVALHLGVITIAVAFTLYAYGLKTISAPKAVTLPLAEPLTASTLGILFLGERLTTLSTLGVILLLFGLLIVSTENASTIPKEAPNP